MVGGFGSKWTRLFGFIASKDVEEKNWWLDIFSQNDFIADLCPKV
jgi:hypothetical protein